jgi:hypothetical protein
VPAFHAYMASLADKHHASEEGVMKVWSRSPIRPQPLQNLASANTARMSRHGEQCGWGVQRVCEDLQGTCVDR